MRTVIPKRSGAAASPSAVARPARDLYARALDPEALWNGPEVVEALGAELRRLADTVEDGAVPDLEARAAALGAEQSRVFLDLTAEVTQPDDREVLIRRATLRCAPLAMVSGAWLQWMSGPGNADDTLALQVLTTYAADVGVGRPRASRSDAYLTLMDAQGIAEYASPPSRLSGDARIPDDAFYLAAVLLLMSRRPDHLGPELMGADLGLRAMGLQPALAMVREFYPGSVDWVSLDPSTPRTAGRIGGIEQIRAAVAELIETADSPRVAERVRLGMRWALAAQRAWGEQLRADLMAARAPWYEMAELIKARAREGAVYHQSFLVAGRPLTDWLTDCRTDPQPFLEVLAASRLVRPGEAERSPLVNGLVGERGPMFRVFAPADLAVIRRWINSLPVDAAPASPAAGSARLAGNLARLAARAEVPAAPEDEPADLRDAYCRLQTRAESPALRRYAERYVDGWLARSAHDIDEAPNQVPHRWDSRGLRPWLLEQHDRHAVEFESTDGLPERDALIDSTVQLAPLTLIDGAWLQGFCDHTHASSDVGHFLFETYWDELGNGVPRLNHPLIYRKVLAEMGVTLAPTGSPDFAHDPRLRTESFALPVYWLSIGRLPQTYLPEILGLNLAMELSGVGGSYRRARLALRKHGFSTQFVDLHNTIDNVATGHSAWAADAVDAYLAAVTNTQGARAQEEIWRRVRIGYRSLNPPSGRRARWAERQARKAAAR